MSVMYNDAAIDDILSRYAGVGIEDIKRAKKSVRERGVDAAVYGERNGKKQRICSSLPVLKLEA